MMAARALSATLKWRFYLITASISLAALLTSHHAALAQQRALGLDISAWQGNISQTTWNNIRNLENRQFVFLRASRGGTTGYYNQSNAGNNNPPGQNTLSQRYDDPYFVQNINRATAAGIYAGSYHFGRMDIIESTLNSNGIPNNGTDEANHFIQMAGAWMRPGYLLPVFDHEAGINQRTASELAQFAIDFSNRVHEVMGIRPAIYIGNNYSSPMNSIPEAASVVASYPTLWVARWPNQDDPNSIPVQTAHPSNYTSTVYGPWDNPPNPTHPWSFWQYASTGRLQSYNNGGSNLDFNVARGGVEFLRDKLVPAVWMNDNSGAWSTMANWNSGQAPVAPVTGPGQVAPVGTQTLPTPRLPGTPGTGPAVTSGIHDTVILDRPNANITVTHSSGTTNIRKLYNRETLNITGGSLNIGYTPSADSTPNSAQFSGPVSLSGSGAMSVHTLYVDPAQTFTLGGGTLTLNTIDLSRHASTPAKIAVTGNINLNPLSNAEAIIRSTLGTGNTGIIDLGGANRTFNVGNGTGAVDLALNVPLSNGGLTKTGAGTLALGALNTYAGDTLLQAGTLRVNTASLSDVGAVHVSSGATLNLTFSGEDYVNSLYLNGIAANEGVWGAPGSGAPNTSPLISGTGRLHVTTTPPYQPPPPPPLPPTTGNIIDDFEVDRGHFGSVYNFSPVSQTFGMTAQTTTNRVTTEAQTGIGSQLINIVDDPGSANWQLRHNSGSPANTAGMVAQPAGNVPLPATGYVGFWLKTDDPGITVRIGIDDPVGTNTTALERGIALNVIADNQWHLYQWDFDNNAHWQAFAGGANSIIDGASGSVTIDSIWFAGNGNAQIYLDNVTHNPLGEISSELLPGDYNYDGVVDVQDYNMWKQYKGMTVPAGAGPDGDSDAFVGALDYVLWRIHEAAYGSGNGSAAAVPEPLVLLQLLPVGLAMLGIGRRRSCRPA